MNDALRALGATFANRDLRYLQLAWAGISLATWAYVIALGVYAYDVGGAGAVGLVALVRLLPGAIAAPFGGMAGDRFSRRAVLIASAVGGAAALAVSALAVESGAPEALVFGLAGLFTVAMVAYIPVEAALLPVVARTPQELSAVNVTHSAVDNVGFLVGAIGTGVLLATTSPQLVFGIAATFLGLAALALAAVRRDERPAYAKEIGLAGVAQQTAHGFRILAGEPGLRLLAAAATLLVFFEGAADVFVVLLVLDLLSIGEGAVGYINGAWGVGALIGGAALAVMLNRGHLAAGLVLGSLLVGAATALPAIWPEAGAAYVAWLGIGIGYTFVEVAGHTLMQRMCSDEALARAFGALETSRLGATAIGSIVASGLAAWLGVRGGLAVLAAILPAFALLRWARLRAFESGAPVDEGRFALLRSSPIFAPLPLATLERLTLDLEAREAQPGETIISQGDHGERFFVIESGEVEVFEGGTSVRTQREGESFGEIALLRDVPRTASVRAVRATRLLCLERDQFIGAVTGLPRSRLEAEAVAESRFRS